MDMQRRDFLKTAAALIAAGASPSLASVAATALHGVFRRPVCLFRVRGAAVLQRV
ncbi:hypothetical protein BG910_10200 [Neisseria chenwenguii]|uniref:Uncharacterized protein n=1 Tax=Neisseria chenwenguii TaxID=1853278 RepID=A0A220S3H5_9NEIS|nr:hypothetical protein BG910_10200 [Neisseria chenwenguii]ROV57201.1 twin-arginine translocation signal domain-containing protein [Neisseria chenwenguii]